MKTICQKLPKSLQQHPKAKELKSLTLSYENALSSQAETNVLDQLAKDWLNVMCELGDISVERMKTLLPKVR